MKKVKTTAVTRKRAPKAVSKTGNSQLQFWSSGSGYVGAWQSSLFAPHEPFTGAWQQNATLSTQSSPLQFSAVYSCITGIATDIGKLPMNVMRETDENPDIWEKVRVSPFLPVLKKPNHYQTRIQFLEQWIISKLI